MCNESPPWLGEVPRLINDMIIIGTEGRARGVQKKINQAAARIYFLKNEKNCRGVVPLTSANVST